MNCKGHVIWYWYWALPFEAVTATGSSDRGGWRNNPATATRAANPGALGDQIYAFIAERTAAPRAFHKFASCLMERQAAITDVPQDTPAEDGQSGLRSFNREDSRKP